MPDLQPTEKSQTTNGDILLQSKFCLYLEILIAHNIFQNSQSFHNFHSVKIQKSQGLSAELVIVK